MLSGSRLACARPRRFVDVRDHSPRVCPQYYKTSTAAARRPSAHHNAARQCLSVAEALPRARRSVAFWGRATNQASSYRRTSVIAPLSFKRKRLTSTTITIRLPAAAGISMTIVLIQVHLPPLEPLRARNRELDCWHGRFHYGGPPAATVGVHNQGSRWLLSGVGGWPPSNPGVVLDYGRYDGPSTSILTLCV